MALAAVGTGVIINSRHLFVSFFFTSELGVLPALSIGSIVDQGVDGALKVAAKQDALW
jgi:hypothetical protein